MVSTFPWSKAVKVKTKNSNGLEKCQRLDEDFYSGKILFIFIQYLAHALRWVEIKPTNILKEQLMK